MGRYAKKFGVGKPTIREAATRRYFLGGCTTGLGALFLQTLAGESQAAIGEGDLDFGRDSTTPLAPLPPQFAARARRVIYLHMAGGPSQLELFEHKPELNKYDGQDCPASFLEGKRFAFISGVPKLLGAQYPFHQAGESGAWISDRLPHLEKHIDDLCFVRSMRTEQFNHVPAQLSIQTGNSRLGYASIGSLGVLRAWNGESEPASLHCIEIRRSHRGRQTALGFGLFAKHTSGCGVPIRRGAHSTSRESAKSQPYHTPGRPWMQ